MIRVVIHSGQQSLQRPLGATLGPDIQVEVVADHAIVLNKIARKQADVVVVDLDSRFASPEHQFSFISQLRKTDLPVLVLTDDDCRSTALELLQQGVYDYFRKPPSPLEMSVVIRRAHEHALLKREFAEMKAKMESNDGCDQLIGGNPRMQEVYGLLRRVASLDAPILISGESGTGKELAARAIHNLGCRADAPFVALSCGAIPDTLIEAEMFGHERGAFTGANSARQGLLEAAGHGTIFLDEIGELSLVTQVKLLRVLQQREFTPLGGNRKISLNARILLATHRDLEAMVQDGQFRRDLFFRVNVMRIEMPPLRDRTEDIPVLANSFLRRYASSCRKTVTLIDPRAMRALITHDWPGNIRELENVIHRAVILADSEAIKLEDLPASLQPQTAKNSTPGTLISYDEVMRDFKRSLAEQTLQECNGNKTRAAVTLNISRAYLHRLLRPSGTQA